MTIERVEADGLYQGADESAYTRVLKASGTLVFVSGQAPKNENEKLMYAGDMEKQTQFVLEMIEKSLAAADADMSDVARRRIFVRDVDRFIEDGAIDHLREFWPDGAECTSTLVQVEDLSDQHHHEGLAEGVEHADPDDLRCLVEIDVTAVVDE